MHTTAVVIWPARTLPAGANPWDPNMPFQIVKAADMLSAPKRNPRQHHETERECPSRRIGQSQTIGHLVPSVVHDQSESMNGAPNHEGPRGTVPQAAQQHRDQKIDVAPSRSLSIAAERDVK